MKVYDMMMKWNVIPAHGTPQAHDNTSLDIRALADGNTRGKKNVKHQKGGDLWQGKQI